NKIIPPLKDLLTSDFYIIALIKPQFEAGREKVKKGVVSSEAVHLEVLTKLKEFLQTINLNITKLTYSPIKGPAGNIEFLAYIDGKMESEINLADVVREAHQN